MLIHNVILNITLSLFVLLAGSKLPKSVQGMVTTNYIAVSIYQCKYRKQK